MMSDAFIICPTQTVTEHVPYEKTVTVNRAPTDESIKLWEEMKEKAYKSLLGQIHIKNNVVEASAIIYQDIYAARKIMKYRFLLNGKEFIDQVELGFHETCERDVLRLLYKKVSEKISSQLTISMLENLDRGNL